MGALGFIKQYLPQTLSATAEEMQSSPPFQITVKGVSCGW